MPRTFEERVAQELDGLYQGALFLAGGDPGGAESLLVDAVTLGFREDAFEGDRTAFERWLEARLVRSFLERAPGDADTTSSLAAAASDVTPGEFSAVSANALFAAAAVIPPRPRAALWMVLLRRWSYDDAATELNVDKSVLVDLLRYRDVLMKEMLGSSGRGGFRVAGS